MTSNCYCCFQCLGESRSLVRHPQFGKTLHQVYQAISKLILGQLLFGNCLGSCFFSLSLYPALPLLSALARLHLHIEPNIRPDLVRYMLWKHCYLVLDFSERIVRFWGHKKLELARWILHKSLNTVNFQCSSNFFAFSQHSDWYMSSMDSFSTYWTVIFGSVSFAYSANCFGNLMTTL